MEYTAGDQHVKAKEEIVAKRPDNLRVEAMSPFGVALLLAAQGSDLAIFEPGKNRFMRGQATADTLYRYVRIPMAPTDAVGLLMGLAPPAFALGSSAGLGVEGRRDDGRDLRQHRGRGRSSLDFPTAISRWCGRREPTAASTTKCVTATIMISAE